MDAVSSSLSLTTVMLFLPVVGLLIILFFMKEEKDNEAIKWTAFGFSVAAFVVSVIMAIAFKNDDAGLQFAQRNDWLATLNITYYVGVDGLSLLLVLLTTIIMPISIMGRSGKRHRRARTLQAVHMFFAAGILHARRVRAARPDYLHIFWD
jgi:NADH-quinone oxidoreductase subunit M